MLKIPEFYEISISNSGPQKLNQKKFITIIECLKTCLHLKIICKFYHLAYTSVHFRTLNHRLPIQRGRLCTKCLAADIGDEIHYVFSCPFFFLLSPGKKIFHHFIVKMQMLIDFSLFFFFFLL